MLDTKLRKTHKLTTLIITLVILIPALLLVALYPQMERAVLKKKAEYEANEEAYMVEMAAAEAEYLREIDGHFDNMVTEACYYIYGCLLRESLGEPVDMTVLEEYGWIDDYYRIRENTDFYAEAVFYVEDNQMAAQRDSETPVEEEASFSAPVEETQVEEETPETEETSIDEEELPAVEEAPIVEADAPVAVDIENPSSLSSNRKNLVAKTFSTTNADWSMAALMDMGEKSIMNQLDFLVKGSPGFITIEFNSYGELADVQFHLRDDVWYGDDIYSSVSDSMDQFMTNALYSEAYIDNEEAIIELIPKDFQAVFILHEDNEFIWDYYQDVHYYSYNWESLYMDIGAIIPVILLAVFVALAALVMPFFKKLDTGWEKIFCMPFEVIVPLGILGFLSACGMFIVMSQTNLTNIASSFGTAYVIGIPLSDQTLYGIMLFVNFCGWALCFLAEYIVFASIRQFFCGPVYYLKERVYCIRFLRWLKRHLVRFGKYLNNWFGNIDLHNKLHSTIFKIVLVNFVILTILCVLWWFGLIGLIIYSVLLFALLLKFGNETRDKYEKVLDATKQMAEGNLKFKIEEDLGMFTPIGQELEKVQQGFSKAVVEEAKSQNMKTELITNVSHDLKTPLTAIITYVDLLKKDDITEEERRSYTAIIDQKSQRLKVLVEDLFEISKASSGNIQMNFMDVDIVNLMKQVRLEMEEKIAASNLNFKWTLPEERLVISLDGQKTYRVFENLLNNVLKYSLPHSRVYVDVIDLRTHVKVVFRNISAVELNEDPTHLTERFVRGDASRKTEGSGLGLAIVKSFVELQHGKFDISIDGDLFKATIMWQK